MRIGDDIPALKIANSDDIVQALKTLSFREREIFKLRTGLNDGYRYTFNEIGRIFKVSSSRVQQIHGKGRRKFLEKISEFLPETQLDGVTVQSVLEQSRELTPFLIAHLKNSPNDLIHLHWQVFEHLIAEFYKQWGYDNVRLVGRSGKTAADVFAMRRLDASGNECRIFIETKRWKKRVGVEVVDRVYGAMVSERTTFGWHMGIIVSVAGFREIKKYTPDELRLMGVNLKDGSDLGDWLKGYRFAKGGLWLPNPSTDLPGA